MDVNGLGNPGALLQALGVKPGAGVIQNPGSLENVGALNLGGKPTVSSLGQLMSNSAELSADELAQAEAFRAEMRTALRSGDFDAAQMAESAPDFLKQQAAESGVSLEEAFGQLGERVEQIRSRITSALAGGALAAPGLSLGVSQSPSDISLESLLAAIGEDSKS
jgi:hypothetical protein